MKTCIDVVVENYLSIAIDTVREKIVEVLFLSLFTCDLKVSLA